MSYNSEHFDSSICWGIVMAWVYLFLGGIAEIIWAIALNYTEGLKISFASTVCLVGLALSLVFLWLAAQTIPIAIAYAIWTGIAIVGVFIVGVFILSQPVHPMSMLFVSMIVAGIIGLKIYTE